jgi:hypothetical protein
MGDLYVDFIYWAAPTVNEWGPSLTELLVRLIGWGIAALVIIHIVNRWRAARP